MSFREFLLYPPFFIFASLALAIVLTFLVFILHQRRRIRRLRQGMKGAGQPRIVGTQAPPPEQQVEAHNAAASLPLVESPSTSAKEVAATDTPSTAAPEAAPAAVLFRQEAVQAVIDEESPVTVRDAEPAIPDFQPDRLPAPPPDQVPPASTLEPVALNFRTFDRKSGLSADLLRAGLIFLAFIVTLALSLVLLPQSTFEGMADSIRYRKSGQPQQEKLALLYLGDEVKGTELHIRGVVRNISPQSIEQLDATIRLYAPDRTLLETAVVRMDWEEIAPNATATFHLSYADYQGQFGSYSVDFKLRQGEPVPYKDMRGALTGN
jgi:hypothetical protein